MLIGPHCRKYRYFYPKLFVIVIFIITDNYVVIYTGPTGPARTLSETRTDPTEFLGDPGRKKDRAGPVGPVYWNLAITV